MRLHGWLAALLVIVVGPARAVDGDRVADVTQIASNVPSVPADLAERVQRYGDARGAVFSGWLADGSGMLVSTRSGATTQVHRVDRAGGAITLLTTDDDPVSSIAVHPRRNGFVFGKDKQGSEWFQLYWYDLDTRAVRLLTDGRSRNTDPLFSHDGRLLAYASTERNGIDTDVWVLDVETGERRAVIQEGGAWQPTDFSPDGRSLLAQRSLVVSESQPVAVDLASGALRRIHDPRRRIGFDAFLYTPDGRGAYFIADDRHGFHELKYRDLASDRDRRLTRHIDWDITEFALSPDGARLAFVANEDGRGTLHVLDTATRREIALPAVPEGVVFAPDFSSDGRRLAFTVNSPISPSDVWVLDLHTMTLERWTSADVGGLDARRFVMPQHLRYPTFDHAGLRRRQVPALVYRPAPRTNAAPHAVVIDIHGGPESQARPTFNAATQFLVNELGIAVITPNVRGSSGYGREWLDLDDRGLREDALRDIGALLDWIARQPDLDAGRVGVTGDSYGGYLALAAMIAYGDRLRGGIDVVGISNFVSFLSRTEDYRRDLRRAEYGDERDPRMRRFLERISPLAGVARIRVPLFVAHGANDPRVPIGEAEQLVRGVRANGSSAWYLRFDDEGHGFRRKANVDHFRSVAMLFWQRHLLDASIEASR